MDTIFHFYNNLRWQDVTDIAINSYILFRFYVLFKGTNTLRALIAIAMLWFFHRIAISVGLIVTSWVIQGITAMAALIIIVIFRNEIRAVLQAKNFKSILWALPQKTVQTPVQILAEGIFDLANKRIGALLVVPGKDDLSDIVQNGLPWRGIISKEMIGSIFWPDNPVHDGAVVILGKKILKVGCILPLTRREDLPPIYGTRHRAALGLSEETDAMVIVVSEERGDVVLVKDSNLERIVHPDELERRLQEHVGMSAEHQRHVRKERFKLSFAAVISVLFVASVWFSISKGLDTLISLEIPIEYMNRDPQKEIIETSANAVELLLGGSGSLLRTIKPEQVRVRLDLSKSIVGNNSYTITQENVSLPPGAVLKGVQPEAVKVTLDIPGEQELPVQVDWVGRLSPDLIMVAAELVPSRVRIIGGKNVLGNIQTIYTAQVPLDTITKSGSTEVRLALNPASLAIAPGEISKIRINYTVQKRNRGDQ